MWGFCLLLVLCLYQKPWIMVLLVGGWDNFLIRVCHCDFFSEPRDSILVSSPENLPIFDTSSTKICKKLSRSVFISELIFIYVLQFQIRWVFFLFVAVAKWNIWCLVGKCSVSWCCQHCIGKKAPTGSHCWKFIFPYSPTFPGSATGTYHSDINVTLEQELMQSTKLFSGIQYHVCWQHFDS